MSDRENWVALIPFDGNEPSINIGYKHNFELLSEIAPDLIKEINHWAAGLRAPMSSERILACGWIDHLNRIHFHECPGDRNHVHALVSDKANSFKIEARKSPYFEPQNILSMLVVRAMNEHIPDERDLHEATLYGRNVVDCDQKEIFECLDAIMAAENPAAGIRLAEQIKVLRYLLPEVADTKNFWQKYKKHSSELFTHLMMSLDCVAKHTGENKKNLRWAALLHDIGKVKTVWISKDGLTNWDGGPNGDHHEVGGEMSDELLKRLGMPEQDREEVVFFVKNHMFERFDNKKGAKEFINQMGGIEQAYDMLTLGLADEQGKRKQEEKEEAIYSMKELVDSVARNEDWEEILDPTIIVVLKNGDII